MLHIHNTLLPLFGRLFLYFPPFSHKLPVHSCLRHNLKALHGVSSHFQSAVTSYIHQIPFSNPTQTITIILDPIPPSSLLSHSSLSSLGWHVMVALVCSLPLPLVY